MTNLYSFGELIYKDYLQMLKTHDNPLVWFELTAAKYRTNTNIILKVLNNYIKNELEKPDFVLIFDKLTEIDNPNEYLFFNNITPSFLKEHLEEYLTYYKVEYKLRYSNKILNTYKEIIKKYITYFKKQIEIKENNQYEETILEFINSKYTLERFCINKGLNLNDFNINKNGIFIKVMKNNQELYRKFLFSIERKKKEMELNIQSDIKKILKAINDLGSDFSLIDLFFLTNYGIRELTNTADNILEINDLKLFRKYMNVCYRDFAIYGNFMNTQRIKLLKATPYTFTLNNELIETTIEDREKIINYLKQNEIPINSKIFAIALSRYYNRKRERRFK